MTIERDGQSTSYYDQIGGAPAVREAVERFYARVTTDPELAPYFSGIDMSRLKVAYHLVTVFTEMRIDQQIVDFAAEAVLTLRRQVVPTAAD